MKRYMPIESFAIPAIRIILENRIDPNDTKKFNIHKGDILSILYINDLCNIGNGEYPVYGIVREIQVFDKPVDTEHHRSRYKLIMDVSSKYKSKIIELEVNNILDIHRFPYRYNMEENPIIWPDPLQDGFFVREIINNQKIDVSVPNDPLLGDADFTEEDLQ